MGHVIQFPKDGAAPFEEVPVSPVRDSAVEIPTAMILDRIFATFFEPIFIGKITARGYCKCLGIGQMKNHINTMMI